MLDQASRIIKGGRIVSVDGRYILVRNNIAFIPKRAIYLTVKVYNKDLLLLKKFDRVNLLVFNPDGALISIIDLGKVLPNLKSDGRVRIKNVIVVYIPYLKKTKMHVVISTHLKDKMKKLINTGKFKDVNEIIEEALKRFLGDYDGED